MLAELRRTPTDEALIGLVESMVYGDKKHTQKLPRGGRNDKTLTFRELLFEQVIEERDVTEHMCAISTTVSGYSLKYVDGSITDGKVDFAMFDSSGGTAAKVEAKLVQDSIKDFGLTKLTPQMTQVANVDKTLKANYGIVFEKVQGQQKSAFSDVKQIALFKWIEKDQPAGATGAGLPARPVLFCFIPVWRPSGSAGSSSSGKRKVGKISEEQ